MDFCRFSFWPLKCYNTNFYIQISLQLLKNTYCFQVQINGRQVAILAEALGGANVDNCPHPCVARPCGEDGECVPEMDYFTCRFKVIFIKPWITFCNLKNLIQELRLFVRHLWMYKTRREDSRRWYRQNKIKIKEAIATALQETAEEVDQSISN